MYVGVAAGLEVGAVGDVAVADGEGGSCKCCFDLRRRMREGVDLRWGELVERDGELFAQLRLRGGERPAGLALLEAQNLSTGW